MLERYTIDSGWKNLRCLKAVTYPEQAQLVRTVCFPTVLAQKYPSY